MLNKRPHILTYVTKTPSGVTRNENGDIIPVQGQSVPHSLICRAEPNGSGKVITSEDGQNVVYSWVIYLNPDADRIPVGTEVQLFEGNVQFSHGTVKFFSKTTKNRKLWV